ncbi:hypothetical protein ATO7_16095 [Oceanococcus atlanticus]|uniref:Transmembrane protein n=1 Tax=Oceanococcus atlanticus TaxID=1317117 RepID=A0A1Y1S9Y4_9GAMM|nr:DUF962 domain-containing protein [Oceanococcus atlanticus]ORE85021.1 hypothetical protein ATO7_16095 [Oceanococcus atlanticus]
MNCVENAKTFAEFYPLYLAEHADRNCRRLHVVGSIAALLLLTAGILSQQWLFLIVVPVVGYACAWVGHFFFEKNRPATFKRPLYSLMGDGMMLCDIARGKIKI